MKADYLQALVGAGFKHIDAVSFVSPKAVPQMADSEQVLALLDPPDDVEIIGIVVNAKGAERAIATDAVSTLGFAYSISPTFLQRNQSQTPEDALDALDAIGEFAFKARMDVIAYISMAFGNPYGDAWSIDEVVEACDLLIESGVKCVSLADTVGLATPKQVSNLVADVMAVHGSQVEIGVHLHARPDQAESKVRAAYEAGCRRFDMAIGGMGGCPFAQDALVGNVATEIAVAELKRLGAEMAPLRPLDALIRIDAGIANKFGATVQ